MNIIENPVKLNSGITFAIALLNIVLLYFYLYAFQEVSEGNRLFVYPIILLFAFTIQMGLIAYYDKSPNRKIFYTLSIVSFIIAILLSLFSILLAGYAKGFNH